MAGARFDRTMVEQTIKYFSDPSIDEGDPNKMRELVGDFVKFERVVAADQLTADARQLAHDFVSFGREWIKQHALESVYLELRT